jgi:hypothetical protein
MQALVDNVVQKAELDKANADAVESAVLNKALADDVEEKRADMKSRYDKVFVRCRNLH